MANGLENRLVEKRHYRRFILLVLLYLAASGLRAEVISDLLIVLDVDGRHYVAQHTLATDGELVVAELPAERISLETRFAGAEWLTFATAHELNPDQLSIWSGSAWSRYRHVYADGLSESGAGVFELNTHLEHAGLQLDDSVNVHWSLTWILPAAAQLTDFEAVAETPSTTSSPGQTGNAPAARWQTSGQVLTFRQSGGKLPSLRIRYSLGAADSVATDSCRDALPGDELCAPDSDNDAVPDFRDICLPPSSTVLALRPPTTGALHDSAVVQGQEPADELGCPPDEPVVLSGVRFRSGQSYLDVASRNVLNRVAHALRRMPEQRFEISSHTDNAGRVDINQRLSETRARSVRQYLLVRGVDAGQLRARGYGESMPAYDNAEAAGRRANRRTELRRLN